MHILHQKKIIALFVCIFLFASTLPVLAQESNPTPTGTPSNTPAQDETTLTPLPPSDTPTPSLEPTQTLENTSTITPTATVAPSDTPTPSPQPTLTLETTSTITLTPILPDATPTPTSLPPTTLPDCTLNGVYQSQITVAYSQPQLPEPSVSYSVVENFTGADGIHISVLQVKDTDFCLALEELHANAGVDFAEPNYSVSLLDTYPNDLDLSSQYYLNNILAPQGWDFTTGSPAVTIAIVDTGVDLTHVDLVGKLLPGYDFVDNDTVPQDENGHGTLVAGIAAANTNNGVGVAGVSWGAQIMPLRVLDAAGNGTYSNVAAAIMWATDHGARVINMSLGGENYSSVLEDAVNYAVSQGVVLVAATGNSGSSTVLYPAAFPGVIGVGATDPANQLAWFSNTGAGVDVVAPGVSIYGLHPGNGYTYASGTSMSAPQVAGFAALLASLPEIHYSSQIVDLIESSARDLGAPGWDPQYGYGLIQIGPAILSVVLHRTATPTPTLNQPLPSPTATRVIIWTTPLPFQTPTKVSSGTNVNSGFPTPTPGEVSMLPNPITSGLDLTPSPTIMAPTESGSATGNNNWFLLVPFGIFCIFVGIALFIYTRRNY